MVDEVDSIQSEQKNKRRVKNSGYIGAPQCFKLDMACHIVNRAFGATCYQVGSSLEHLDWRDVDVRMILDDAEFHKLFPEASLRVFQHDARWLLLTTSISEWFKQQTGLHVDFQFQPETYANKHHRGARSALGMRVTYKDEHPPEKGNN